MEIKRDRATKFSISSFFIKQLPLGPLFTGESNFAYGFKLMADG
jgi:hypothetical protein